MKHILTIFFVTVLMQTSSADTWSEAYPYKQRIEGQDVVVKAISYDPYAASPTLGVTRVYFRNKLLYSIDRYYRERIFTSNDGEYLAVVYTSNSTGLNSYSLFGIERIDFSQPAIEVFKHGQPCRTFTLKEVIDTTMLLNNGQLFYWGYYIDSKKFEYVEDDCEICREVYGRRILRFGDTTEIDPQDLEECRGACDSLQLLRTELKVLSNSVYVENNALFILTNQDMVVRLDFSDMNIEKIPFNAIVPDKQNFNPPKFDRNYNKIRLPDKFAQPRLKDGTTITEGLAALLGLSATRQGDEKYIIFIDQLVISHEGKCVELYLTVYDRQISESFLPETINQEMTEMLYRWIKEQTFRTNLIPRGFEKYSFFCIENFK